MPINPQYGTINADNPLATLWTGQATIYEYQDVIDSTTHQTTQQEVAVVVNEPCRISHYTGYSTDVDKGAAMVSENIRLFIRPNLTIKPGSVITVTQHGVTQRYKRSGEPAVYCNHQEIGLELYDNEA